MCAKRAYLGAAKQHPSMPTGTYCTAKQCNMCLNSALGHCFSNAQVRILAYLGIALAMPKYAYFKERKIYKKKESVGPKWLPLGPIRAYLGGGFDTKSHCSVSSSNVLQCIPLFNLGLNLDPFN